MSYQDVKDRLYKGHRKIANNTYLQLEEYYLGDNTEVPAECIDMRLHGNLVASFHKGCFYLYSAAWHTTTTKDRLNLAISLARVNENNLTRNGKLLKFYQVGYQWYYGNYHKRDPKFVEGMCINYNGEVIGGK